MGTSFEIVYDRALTIIVDYRLNKLAQSDYDSFVLYLEGILVLSIPDFDGCMTSLEYDITTKTFNGDLTQKEINILARFMVIGWFTGRTQDVTQFELALSNREFKHYAEGQNLKEKSTYLDKLIEKNDNEITKYQLSGSNFAKIFGQE